MHKLINWRDRYGKPERRKGELINWKDRHKTKSVFQELRDIMPLIATMAGILYVTNIIMDVIKKVKEEDK